MLRAQNLSLNNHAQLRADAIEYMQTHRSEFEPGFPYTNADENEEDFDNYIHRMKQAGIWAEGAIIEATAMVLNVQIDIIDFGYHIDTPNRFTAAQPPQPNHVILLLRVNHNHYHAVCDGVTYDNKRHHEPRFFSSVVANQPKIRDESLMPQWSNEELRLLHTTEDDIQAWHEQVGLLHQLAQGNSLTTYEIEGLNAYFTQCETDFALMFGKQALDKDLYQKALKFIKHALQKVANAKTSEDSKETISVLKQL